MNLQPLTWSEPRTTGWASISAKEGESEWRITPVPNDVTRIYFTGHDADGTIVSSCDNAAYTESAQEALILVDILRAGTDDLPEWRDQLEAAGFIRSYPEAADTDTLSQLWHDTRKTGLYQITVKDGVIYRDGQTETSVSSTYEANGAMSWHNVSMVGASPERAYVAGGVKIRSGLPEGIDPLKAGVAAAIAIRDARAARGGSFAIPLGGATKKH